MSRKLADMRLPAGATENIAVESVVVGQRFRKDHGDIDALARSMEQLGQLQPIVVTPARMLIAGERRLMAASQLGWRFIVARVLDLKSILAGEYAENEVRKDFTPSERVAIGRALEAELGDRRGGDRRSEAFQAAGAGPTSRDVAGKHAGFKSAGQYARAKTVVEQGVPDLVDKMDSGAVSVTAAAEVAALPAAEQQEIVACGEKQITAAYRKLRKEKGDKRRAERVGRNREFAKVENAPLPSGLRALLIAADPPWKYENPPMGDSERSIEDKYQTMTLDEVCAFAPDGRPMHEIAAPNAVLALWVTAPQLLVRTPAGLMLVDQVCRAWGDPHWNDAGRCAPKRWFTPRAQIVWDKVDPEAVEAGEDGGRPGLGYWVRTQHEFMIIATRGDVPIPLPANRPRSVYREPAGPHSVKPDGIYALLETMFPEYADARLELFAIKPRPGWVTWGKPSSWQGQFSEAAE